jgi:lipoate-protein ligase A
MLRKIKSLSNCPYTNLSLEQFIFTQNIQTLLLYRNKPSIVLGRNQQIFKEVNTSQTLLKNIKIVRRQSGGGTVYHSMGNTNYFYTHSPEFKKDTAIGYIKQALHLLDIPAELSSRHDILVHGKKISGTAFKITNKNAYTHGTMLIDMDVSVMRLLKACKDDGQVKVVGNGTDSVYTPVTTLRDYSFTVDHLGFCNAVFDVFDYYHSVQFVGSDIAFQSYKEAEVVPVIEFKEVDGKYYLDQVDITADIMREKDRLESVEWIFGHGKYELQFNDVILFCEKGIVVKCECSDDAFVQFIKGKQIGSLIMGQYLVPSGLESKVNKIINAL